MGKIANGICISLLLVTCAVLGSCKSVAVRPKRGTTAIRDMRTVMRDAIATDKKIASQPELTIPKNIDNALLPSVSSKSSRNGSGSEERFNISVNNETAQAFFMGLVKGTKYNIVVSPKITGTISLNLKNVTIPEVLEAVRDTYGYDFERTSYGFKVNPPSLETRLFTVNYLDVIRNGESSTVISSGGITGRNTSGETSTSLTGGTSTSSTDTQESTAASEVTTTTQSDFWKTLKETLEAMIGDKSGGQVIINEDSGTVAVRGYPSQIKEVAQYLDAIQNTMSREVVLDAKVLEVTLNKDYQLGIDWDLVGFKTVSTATLQSRGKTFLQDFTQFLTMKATHGGANHKRFSAVLQALSNQGNVEVLSSPRVATLNNQKAVIKVGDDEFFVTDISSSTVTSGGGTDTAQDVQLTPFFSGVALDVTPQIDSKGGVTLHIHPVVSTVTEKVKTFTTNDETQSLPLAFSEVREADTVVHAKNRQIIIIGGLMQNKTSEKLSGVPFLDKVPFIGAAFRRTEQEALKSELVILLRPTVVENSSWQKRLKVIANRYKSLDEGYHIGPHPEHFGNLGETDGYRYK